MAHNKEYLNANAQRLYPFRSPLLPEIFSTEVFLDLIISVTNNFILPIKVTEVEIYGDIFSLTVKDNLGKLVGVFGYRSDLNAIEMYPRSPGCRGKLLVDLSQIQFKTDGIFRTYVDVEIELKAIKLFKQQQQFTYDNNLLTGDVIIDEDLFVNYSIDNINNTLGIGSLQQFRPVCEIKQPIKSINNLKPNSDGFIELSTENTQAVFLTKKYPTVLEVSSIYNIEDFNKYALTGPIGDTGDVGDKGDTGADGFIVCNSTYVEKYYGFYYDGSKLCTLYEPGTKVVAYSYNEFYVLDGTKIKKPLEVPVLEYDSTEQLKGFIKYNDELIIYGENGLIKRLDKDFNLLFDYTQLSQNITSLDVFGDSIYAVTSNNILCKINLTTGFYLYPYTPTGTITKIKATNNLLYILYDLGKYQVLNGPEIQLSTTKKLTDIYFPWVVGNNGLLAYIDNTQNGSVVTNNFIKTNEHINAIDGIELDSYCTLVGNSGICYEYKNGVWTQLGIPPILDILSVDVIDYQQFFVYGKI